MAITADTRDMQAELNVVWDYLLPAFRPTALAVNPGEGEKLKEALGKLAVKEGHVVNVISPPGAAKPVPTN